MSMKWKAIAAFTTVLFFVTLIVPTMLVLPFMDRTEEKFAGELTEGGEQAPQGEKENTSEPSIEVSVYRTSTKQQENLPLEEYVVGVVASEMPAEFEVEALKAQALAARTFIVKQMKSDEKLGVPEGSDVTDTVMHQVYKSKEDLKKEWKEDYEWKMQKIQKAVYDTKGEILTYDGQPISATYFSTSNGFTENAEDYWDNKVPYLKSVESPWDINTPKYKGKKVIPVEQFETKLGVKLENNDSVGKIIEKTKGNRVSKVAINGKVLSGKEVREKLDLKSTDFAWERKGDKIVIRTKGNGHGVGMSQYGANGMAQEGKSYKEILQHYYKGVEISKI